VVITKSIGMICLCAYLIIVGAALLFGLGFSAMGIVEGILAIVAGILLLFGK